jgi:predicted DNA-binding protein
MMRIFKVTFTIRLTVETVKEIDDLAAAAGVSASKFVEEFITTHVRGASRSIEANPKKLAARKNHA